MRVSIILLILLSILILGYLYNNLSGISEKVPITKTSIEKFRPRPSKISRTAVSGIYPAQARIIAIGDLHGDFDALESALGKAKLINSKGRWIGGNTHVVQLGDILDRRPRLDKVPTPYQCCDEIKIMDTLYRLQKEASKYGGAVHCILGNHELMNVMGDLRYTTPETNRCFG